jgi:hypothetical protein
VNRSQLRAFAHERNQEQANITQRQRQLAQESSLGIVQIGKRDATTGKDEVQFKDGQAIAGVRLFNTSVAEGTVLQASQAHGSSRIALDSRSRKPALIKPPTASQSRVKILFAIRTIQQVQFFIGGDRSTPIPVRTVNLSAGIFGYDLRLNALGNGLANWQVDFGYSFNNLSYLEVIRPSGGWMLSSANDFRVAGLQASIPVGYGFFTADNQAISQTGQADYSLAAYEGQIYQTSNASTFVLPPDITKSRPSGSTGLVLLSREQDQAIYRRQNQGAVEYYVCTVADFIPLSNSAEIEQLIGGQILSSITFAGNYLYVPEVKSSFLTQPGIIEFTIFELQGDRLVKVGTRREKVPSIKAPNVDPLSIRIAYYP